MASTRTGTTCSILTLLAVTAAPVALSQSLPPALIACAIEKKDKVRLECFDREVARVVQASAGVAPTPSAPAQVAPAAPAVAATQPAPAAPASSAVQDEFGLSGELARKRREVNQKEKPAPTQLRAAVAKVSQKPYGEYVIELDNGQVWEQPEKKSSFSIKAGDTVRISPGAMGSYFLAVDAGTSTKVRRIR